MSRQVRSQPPSGRYLAGSDTAGEPLHAFFPCVQIWKVLLALTREHVWLTYVLNMRQGGTIQPEEWQIVRSPKLHSDGNGLLMSWHFSPAGRA